jgi:hypothetical protein
VFAATAFNSRACCGAGVGPPPPPPATPASGGIFAALGTCLSACLGGKAAAGQGNAVGCGLARAAVAEEGIEA